MDAEIQRLNAAPQEIRIGARNGAIFSGGECLGRTEAEDATRDRCDLRLGVIDQGFKTRCSTYDHLSGFWT